MDSAVPYAGGHCAQPAAVAAIRNAAQQRLGFYASLAFRVVSPVYIEDDIPHVDMLLAA
jgi:predicted GNAT family N-acyltransferase